MAPSMAARSLVYSSELIRPSVRSRSNRRTASAAAIKPCGGIPGLATTTGAAGTRASRIIERSEACWEIVMARISRARPMALSRPATCSVVGNGRSSPAAGGGEINGTRAPTLAWRRVRYSSSVISPWSRSAIMVLKRDTMLASAPANLVIDDAGVTADTGAEAGGGGVRAVNADAEGALEIPDEAWAGSWRPAAPLSMEAGTPPLSRRARLTLAISDMGFGAKLVHTTICFDCSGRMARMASYISRAFRTWPVFWKRTPRPKRAARSAGWP